MVGVLSLILVFQFMPQAFAGQWDAQCQAAGAASQAQCQGAAQSVNAADASRSAAASAAANARGATVNPNAGAMSSNTGAQNSALQQALPKCQQAKSDCESKCDQAKQQAQQIASGPPSAIQMQAQQDVVKIPGTKQSQCSSPIDNMIAQMQNGQSPLPGQKNDADASKNASNGQMPPMTPPQSGNDKKADPQQQQVQTQQPLNCATAGSSKYSTCNDDYVQKCTANMADTECNAFDARYCNISTGTTAPAPSSSIIAGQTVIADQRGEGTGTDYCNKAVSYDFCVNHTNHNSCTTCVNYRASQTPGCLLDPTNCVADTSPQQAAANSCPDLEPVLTTNNTISGTGTAVTSTQISIQSKTAVGTQRAPAGSGSFAGGIAASGDDASGAATADKKDAAKNSGLSTMSVGAIRGDNKIQPAVDVAQQYGPSLFNIGSKTYQNLCAAGRLNCHIRQN